MSRRRSLRSSLLLVVAGGRGTPLLCSAPAALQADSQRSSPGYGYASEGWLRNDARGAKARAGRGQLSAHGRIRKFRPWRRCASIDSVGRIAVSTQVREKKAGVTNTRKTAVEGHLHLGQIGQKRSRDVKGAPTGERSHQQPSAPMAAVATHEPTPWTTSPTAGRLLDCRQDREPRESAFSAAGVSPSGNPSPTPRER